jgi:hypothetical protein
LQMKTAGAMQVWDRCSQEAARVPDGRGTWAHPHAARGSSEAEYPRARTNPQQKKQNKKPSKKNKTIRSQMKALRTHFVGDPEAVWTGFATAPAVESFACFGFGADR